MLRLCPFLEQKTTFIPVRKTYTAPNSATLGQMSAHYGKSLIFTTKHSNSQVIIKQSRACPLVHRLREDRYAHTTIYRTYSYTKITMFATTANGTLVLANLFWCLTAYISSLPFSPNARNSTSTHYYPPIPMATIAWRTRTSISRLFFHIFISFSLAQ